MATRRESTENITGFGTGVQSNTGNAGGAPAVPVPTPTGGGTGQPVYGPNVAPNGAIYTQGGTMNVADFINNFTFQNAQPGTAQYAFNQIKQKYGPNAAFSYAMSNWNHFSSYDPSKGFYGAMAQAGISPVDQKRLINTYSAASKSKDLGDAFRHESGGMFGQDGYNVYAKQFFDPNSAAALQALRDNKAAFRTQMAGGGYDYTNAAQVAGPTFNTAGGVNPATGQSYASGLTNTKNADGTINLPGAAPAITVPPPAALQGPTTGINPSTGLPYGQMASTGVNPATGKPYGPVPAAPVQDQSGWDTWNQRMQQRTRTPSTVDPLGTAPVNPFRFKPTGK